MHGAVSHADCPGCRPPPDTRHTVSAVSYVHTVPDHCDRIVWRGRYYHLESMRVVYCEELRAGMYVPNSTCGAVATQIAAGRALCATHAKRAVSYGIATEALTDEQHLGENHGR